MAFKARQVLETQLQNEHSMRVLWCMMLMLDIILHDERKPPQVDERW